MEIRMRYTANFSANEKSTFEFSKSHQHYQPPSDVPEFNNRETRIEVQSRHASSKQQFAQTVP